jgi:hypothetical protein
MRQGTAMTVEIRIMVLTSFSWIVDRAVPNSSG